MKIFHETEGRVARLLAGRGFARLKAEAVLCSDRSLADAPPPPDAPPIDGDFAEVAFEFANAELFEVFPTDLPPARYFDIPMELLKDIKPSLVKA